MEPTLKRKRTKKVRSMMAAIAFSMVLSSCGGGGGGGSGTGTGAGSGTGVVPDTGQSDCYYLLFLYPEPFVCSVGNETEGQDGFHRINAMSYKDNGDGTITDDITGLTWQKCTFGKYDNDCLSGLAETYTWSSAKNQCENLTLAGTGWRLPTVFELTRLVNYGNSSAITINKTAFPDTGPWLYWTSTANALFPNDWAWYVEFSQGSTWADDQTNSHYVRCVRG